MHDKQVSVIYYVKANKAKRQSIRFPKTSWTAAEARGVCGRAGGSFEAAGPASESDLAVVRYGLELLRIRARLAEQSLGLPATQQSTPESPGLVISEVYEVPAESIQESDDGGPVVIRGCTFLQAGLNKPKNRLWPTDLLRKNISLFEGCLCYIDHPGDGKQRSLHSLAGRTTNPRWDEATQSVVGDISLLENDAAKYVRTVFSDEVIRTSNQAGLSVIFDQGDFDLTFQHKAGKTVQVPSRLGPGKPQLDFVASPTGGGVVGSI